MANKRPNQNQYSGNHCNSNKKARKEDFNDFKPPGRPLGYQNGPTFGSHNRANSHQQSNRKQPTSTAAIARINLPVQPSIADKPFEDDCDDDIMIMASQQAEEKERMLNQQRVQMTEELNLSYTSFETNRPGSSTQHGNGAIKTGFTEQIQNNLFVDLTISDEERTAAVSSNRIPLKQTANPKRDNNRLPPSGSSEKENGQSTQVFREQLNQISSLKAQLAQQNNKAADLQDKLLEREGESANLRRDKKLLEEQIRALKSLRLNESQVVKEDPEKEKLREQIRKLKAEQSVQNVNMSALRFGASPYEEIVSNTRYFTNIQHRHSPSIELAPKMLDLEVLSLSKTESLKVRRDREISTDVVSLQARLAKVNMILLAGGRVDGPTAEILFSEASFIITRIAHYIEYLEGDQIKEIIFDTNPAETAWHDISYPYKRGKIADFDRLANKLNRHDGFVSLFQVEPLHSNEICHKPRRIIAFYATIAQHSRKFSEKLLSDDVLSDDDNQKRTFVSILMDTLENFVSESDDVFDYFGLAMASASLLVSLASHYNEFECDNSVDETLSRFFRILLELRCDDPIMMKSLSGFLVHVSTKSAIMGRLCTNFKTSEIVVSCLFKYCLYPPEACTFRLFTSYLMTAFKIGDELNQLEVDLLLETTMNLNRIASNIQKLEAGALNFLNRQTGTSTSDICGCLSTLINAIIWLNHLALSNRHFVFKQANPDFESNMNEFGVETLDEMEKNYKESLLSEIAKSCTIVLADLFVHVDPFTDFPTDLIHANRLEQICQWLKSEDCFTAYGIDKIIDTFKIIEIHPNIRGCSDDEEMPEGISESDEVRRDEAIDYILENLNDDAF